MITLVTEYRPCAERVGDMEYKRVESSPNNTIDRSGGADIMRNAVCDLKEHNCMGARGGLPLAR